MTALEPPSSQKESYDELQVFKHSSVADGEAEGGGGEGGGIGGAAGVELWAIARSQRNPKSKIATGARMAPAATPFGQNADPLKAKRRLRLVQVAPRFWPLCASCF